jgi:hypothetical protein
MNLQMLGSTKENPLTQLLYTGSLPDHDQRLGMPASTRESVAQRPCRPEHRHLTGKGHEKPHNTKQTRHAVGLPASVFWATARKDGLPEPADPWESSCGLWYLVTGRKGQKREPSVIQGHQSTANDARRTEDFVSGQIGPAFINDHLKAQDVFPVRVRFLENQQILDY